MAFTDSFNGAGANTNLQSWTPTGGTAWTQTVTNNTDGAIVNTGGYLRTARSGPNVYECDNQGTADHYTQASLYTLSSFPSAVCVRLVNATNWIGWRLSGTGASGFALTKNVAGTLTSLVTTQGVAGDVYRIEASGTTIKLFSNGTQVGSDQTVTEHQTETSQGLVCSFNAVVGWIDNFEAGSLGGATTYTLTASLSAAVQKQQSITAALDSAIQRAHTNSASVDAAIQRALGVSANTDAAVQQSRAATASTDAAILRAFTISAALDSAIQQARSASSSLDAYLIATGTTAISASLDAAVRYSRAVTASTDAAIQRAVTASANLDAALSVSGSVSANLDAYIQAATVALVQLDAAVRIGRTVSVGLDAYISAGTTLTADDLAAIDALIVSRLGEVPDAVWDTPLEAGLTARQMMRVMFAALAGKREGIGTATERYYGHDGVTPRITLTPDQYGNGTPVVDGA